MKIGLNGFVATLLLATALNGAADEFLPTLKVSGQTYSNVTVTKVTATDIYFSHAQGMGNAKLKNLEPADQKRFKFDTVKSQAVEKQQAIATGQYHQEVLARKPAPKPPVEEEAAPELNSDGDPVAPQLYARSFRGQRPPQIIVDQWITPSPNVEGKFVLVDFWATWCGPCKKSIPHLNELQAKFKDQLVIIGISDETEAAVRQMTSPAINYSVGIDPQARTMRAVEVRGIPHAILIDPKGMVRFEGMPGYLDEKGLAGLIAKYSN